MSNVLLQQHQRNMYKEKPQKQFYKIVGKFLCDTTFNFTKSSLQNGRRKNLQNLLDLKCTYVIMSLKSDFLFSRLHYLAQKSWCCKMRVR
jgi:hypothetical protein